MTDDTLLKECEETGIVRHYECQEDTWYSCPESPGGCADDQQETCNCGYETRLALLLTFARAQQAKGEKINQAKGLREAAELIQDSMKPGAAMPMREQMIDYLLNHAWALEHQKGAQATAREAELPTRRDP